MRTLPLVCLIVGACATTPEPTWLRIDGKPVSDLQFEADRTACRGETAKAGTAQREAKIYLPGEENPMDTVYSGCMAQHGYVQRAAPQAR